MTRMSPTIPVTILRPGDSGYDAGRSTFNLMIHQRPPAIALPRDVDDVGAAVVLAAEHGLRVAPQGGGHNAGPLGPLGRRDMGPDHGFS
jgi:FAD/FMN-containing dehydrogenase